MQEAAHPQLEVHFPDFFGLAFKMFSTVLDFDMQVHYLQPNPSHTNSPESIQLQTRPSAWRRAAGISLGIFNV